MSYLSIADICERIPSAENQGRRITPHNVARWFKGGVLVGKERVKLRGVKIGRGWFTTEEWLAEFIRAQNPHLDADPTAADAGGDHGVSSLRTPAQRQRDSERAARELAAL